MQEDVLALEQVSNANVRQDFQESLVRSVSQSVTLFN